MSLANCYATADSAIRTTKLEPCDIILWINEKNDPINRLSRWAIGKYCHVAMYLGNYPILHSQKDYPYARAFNVPLVYESRGRGVIISSLLPQAGARVTVMRVIAFYPNQMHGLLNTAFDIAADEEHFYDYFSIVHSILPRIIAEKLRLPLPLKYHRDIFMICSEAVAELWWRIGDRIFLYDKEVDGKVVPGEIPLPGDFAKSPILEFVRDGKLMEDIVP